MLSPGKRVLKAALFSVQYLDKLTVLGQLAL